MTLKVSGAELSEGGATRRISVLPKSVAAAEFILKFPRPGDARLEVSVRAGVDADAVVRILPVRPDGRPVHLSTSSLVDGETVLELDVPKDAIPGTTRSRLTLHRGPLTQFIEGLDGMLVEPYGCFEQTSSCNYPNLMIVRYLRANGIRKPDIEKRAMDFLARGYQRLLGFEVGSKSGGFSLYGQAPASPWLTAYGLMEFQDMAKVYPVDPALLDRIRAFLKGGMRGDGSFALDGGAHERVAGGLLAETAYVVWALGSEAPETSLRFLRENLPEIRKDAYLSALAANALRAKDPQTANALARGLKALALREKIGGKIVLRMSAARSLAWGYGETAGIEAMALSALAVLDSGESLDFAREALASLQSQIGPRGAWHSTHATVLSLKALERASIAGRNMGPATATVRVGEEAPKTLRIPAEETAAPVVLPIELKPGPNRIRIRTEGAPLAARLSCETYVPWAAAEAPSEPAANPLLAHVRYDKTEAGQGSAVSGTLEISAKERTVEVPMVEWGLPAGFEPSAADLDAAKADGLLERWEISGRTLRLYFPDLPPGPPKTLRVRFTATSKGSLAAPAGRAYEYYRREAAVALPPVRFTIR